MLGDEIKRYRKSLNMTQNDLAKKANISRVAIGNYERGDRHPTLQIAQKIATALNISLETLTEDTGTSYCSKKETSFMQYLMELGYNFDGIPNLDDDEGLTFIKEWGKIQFFSYEQNGKWIFRTAPCKDIQNALDSIEKFIEFTMEQLIKNSAPPPERL